MTETFDQRELLKCCVNSNPTLVNSNNYGKMDLFIPNHGNSSV